MSNDNFLNVGPLYIVCQAFKKEFGGFKFENILNNNVAIFRTKEEAEQFIEKIKQYIIYEQCMGKREPNNLHPEKGIDLVICECYLDYDMQPMIDKGWDLNQQYKKVI